MSAMIEINDLTKTYGRGQRAILALRGFNLEIGSGMFGLLGPNGAGKTTLMRILAGIVRSTTGRAAVDGHDLATEEGRRTVKSFLGYLPQELGLYPDMTARRFVEYMAMLKGVDLRRRSGLVGEMLEATGLAHDADRKIKTYSGGMKRRVGIAQALVNDPRLLIVDEPTAGLDPEERIRFRNLLVDLARDRAVILSTHIVEDIGQTCRTMAVLAKGRLLFHGSPFELTAAAEGYVWTALSPDGRKPDGGTIVVSMIHLAEGVHYRLVGPRPEALRDIKPAAPGLEDGYVRLMQTAK
uniref:Cytochrome c biogenesis ATP-binding export protein ccmA n=1 Tax=uncultured Aminicenantes bacterium TaxID=174294 RepID=Q2YZY2_9BACT|nr:cytochrome c biogenesis ATP-binding export protein ccmA [uncultured Aminicenantes bacterium]